MKKRVKAIEAFLIAVTVLAAAGLTACGSPQGSEPAEAVTEEQTAVTQSGTAETSAAAETETAETAAASEKEQMENSADGEHVITADGETAEYTAVHVVKTGEAEGDEADFYGENAAVFATNGASLTLTDLEIETDGTHANAVFSYGEGTTVNISDSVISTSGNCSGGLMTTGGGTMNAENLTIHTTGRSSAAIRSDRGGGTVHVSGGSYTTDGTGSPVIYSTADITVSDAEMTSTASQGVVVEGRNSVTLENVTLTADNNTKNSDKSDYFQAVMIYQSMSGDAAQGPASFTMTGGSLVNKNGDIFFVNNTSTTISLNAVQITNEDSGAFLRAAAAGWGSEGTNGGNVTMKASRQTMEGDMLVDAVSTLNLYLTDGSSFSGAINPSGTDGDVYVDIGGGSTWTLTADSYITSLTCDADSVNLNGYTLYVGGTAYSAGTESSGEPVAAKENTVGGMGTPPDGMGTPPDGMGTPPDGMGTPPDGNPGSGTPPAKPGSGSDSGSGTGT